MNENTPDYRDAMAFHDSDLPPIGKDYKPVATAATARKRPVAPESEADFFTQQDEETARRQFAIVAFAGLAALAFYVSLELYCLGAYASALFTAAAMLGATYLVWEHAQAAAPTETEQGEYPE
jgi:hypothetical protein